MTWYFFVRTPGQTATSPAAEQSVGPSLIPAPSPGNSEPFGEYTYRGKVGPYDATFQLRFDADGRVSGTYTMPVNKDLVLRLEGRNPKGKLFLDEYTRERLSAHLELTLSDSSSEVR